MNNIVTKDQQTCDVVCKKTPTAKTERDLYRVCPSKLSKRELENLYFALLENNLELKKNLHAQKERLKVLSTKVQRLTVVQRNAAGKEKDCCNNKVLVAEQKDIIEDLTKNNEQLADRVRLLNMRLCSARQFLRRSSGQTVKCAKCGICPLSLNNTSATALNARSSQGSVKMTTVSCQCIPVEAPDPGSTDQSPKLTRTVETEMDQGDLDGTEKQCNENKCRTVMDELKQKIVNLQEELSTTHDEYSKRISKLESDVSGLHSENYRVRSRSAASEHALQLRERKTDDLQGRLRQMEGRVNDLTMQLTIERRKVKELETALRLAKGPSQVNKIIEKLHAPQESKVKHKTSDAKPSGKPSDGKQNDGKPSNAEPSDGKLSDSKHKDAKTNGTKPNDGKPINARPRDDIPSIAKPDGKSNDAMVSDGISSNAMQNSTKLNEDTPTVTRLSEGISSNAMPSSTMPNEDKPSVAKSKEGISSNGMPSSTMPNEDKPSVAKSKEGISSNGMPSSTMPNESTAPDVSGSATSYYSTKQDGSDDVIADPTVACHCKECVTCKRWRGIYNKLVQEAQEASRAPPSPTHASVPPAASTDLPSNEEAKSRDDTKLTISDDSGCTDLNKSSDAEEIKVQTKLMERMNQEMMQKISELQMQLDGLQVRNTGEPVMTEERRTSDLDNFDYDEEQMTVITIIEERPVVLEIQDLGDDFRKKKKPKKEKEDRTREIIDKETSTPIKNSESKTSTSRETKPDDKTCNDVVLGLTPDREDRLVSDQNMNNNDLPSRNDKTNNNEPKKDNDNRYQIPGPIPTSKTNRDKKKKNKTSKSKDRSATDIKTDGKGVKISSSDNENSDKDKIAEAKSDVKPETTTSAPKIDGALTVGTAAKSLSQNTEIVDLKYDNGSQEPSKETEEKNLSDKSLLSRCKDSLSINRARLNADDNTLIGDIEKMSNIAKLEDKTQVELSECIKEQAKLKEETVELSEIKTESVEAKPKERTSFELPGLNKESIQAKRTNAVTDEEFSEVKKVSASSYYARSYTVTPPPSLMSHDNTGIKCHNAESIHSGELPGEDEQCLSHVTICRCPTVARREVNVFRTCSGTLRFHTTGVSGNFRHCACLTKGNMGLQVEAFPPQPPAPGTERETLAHHLEMALPKLNHTLSTAPVQVDPTTVQAAPRRDLATSTAMQPGHRDSGTSTGIQAPNRRDSATYTTVPPSSRQDFATYTAMPPSSRRDSATYTAIPPTSRRESATYTAMPPSSRRDSATYTEMPPSSRRDSATYTAIPPSSPRDSATYTAMPPPGRRDSATYTKQGTYEIKREDCKCSNSTSPANTEREISSLSDLPPERDARPARGPPRGAPCPRSPGELPTATTGTSPDTDTRSGEHAALSDGEIPPLVQRPHRKLSFSEQPTYTVRPVTQSSEAQMEATLNAISEELAHCRKLLAAARDHEVTSVNSTMSSLVGSVNGAPEPGPRGPERVHRLHAAANSRRLADTATNTAIFTLHIGTLVLSDEAVLNSRDKALCLTWQFYDQPLAMTRMRAGRVVLFDFSTEYDVAFNDDFLNYMKQEEMPITICDVNKQEEPFATCSLPLRDALIHTNRRADMSLALMAGPSMRAWEAQGGGPAPGADPLVAGDELGVLDLWCTLRVSPRLCTAINTHISRNSFERNRDDALTAARNTSRFEYQSCDDEDPETRVSQDMLVARRKDNRLDWHVSEMRSAPPSREWSGDRPASEPNTRDLLHQQDEPLDESEQKRRASMQTQKSSASPSANIRSPDEMKRALERNVQPLSSRFAKMEDELSQAQSTSMCSLRNAAEKRRMQNIKYSSAKGTHVPEGLQDMLRAERKLSTAAAVAKQNLARKGRVPFSQNSRDEDTDTAVTRKYNNIGQLIGLNKIMEASKKTVTYTDFATPANYPAEETPVKQDSNEDTQQSIDITVLWLALNEECEAMVNPEVHRLYVAYSFLGRRGADLETPISLPKPKHYADKCYFNFKKTFNLHDADLPLLGHMSRCRAGRAAADPRDCLVFNVVSEPPEDPLGLSSCEDIGNAYLYLGDILAYSAGGAGYTEVVPVRAAASPGAPLGARPGAPPGAVCGVLAVRIDGLHVLRRCLSLSHSSRDLTHLRT